MRELRQHSEVSNIELFYDLIFAYAISRITTVLHLVHHDTIPALYLVEFAVMVFMFWTVWTYQTVLVNRFFQENIQHGVFMLFDMFIVIVLSQSLTPNFASTQIAFPGATSLLLFSIAVQYLLRSRHLTDPRQLKVAYGLARILIITSVIGAITIIPWAPYSVREVVYILSMIYANIAPIFMKDRLTAFPAMFEHLTERYSLFTLLLFGEAIIAVTEVVDVHHFDWLSIPFFLIIVALFWVYFTIYQQGIDRHKRTAGIALINIHYFVFVGLDLVAAIVTLYLKHELIGWQFALLMTIGLWFFLGGSAMMLSTYGYRRANEHWRLLFGNATCSAMVAGAVIWFCRDWQEIVMVLIALFLLGIAWWWNREVSRLSTNNAD